MANTRAQQTTLISTNLPDNSTKSITPLKLRQVENAGVSAYAFQDDDNDFTGVNTHAKEVRWHKGADLASATALALGVTGNYHHITGSTEIETLSTKQHGTRMLFHFVSNPNLKHSSNLILPGSVDLKVEAGSNAEFVSEGSGVWRLTQYLPINFGGYVTLSKASFDALVAANGLVAGWTYLVTGAYASSLYGIDFDIQVSATSTNTINPSAFIVNFGPLMECDTDASFGSVFIRNGVYGAALTSAQCLSYANEYWAGALIFIKNADNVHFVTNVSDDPGVIILSNVKALSNEGQWIDGAFGTFDPNTDTFTPNNGTYTPTLSDPDFSVENINYVRNGQYVTITAMLSYAGVSTGSKTLNISLPIPSTFATFRQAWGQVSARGGTSTFNQGWVESNVSGGIDIVVDNPASFTDISVNLTYIIL